jgi:hypothetical protein
LGRAGIARLLMVAVDVTAPVGFLNGLRLRATG